MKIISDTELRIATLTGAVILLQPGQEREVADEIGLIALQMGARTSDGSVSETPKRARNEDGHYVADDPSTPDVNEAWEGGEAPEEEEKNLVDELVKIIEGGDPKNFKANGGVKATVINKVMGYTVPANEREAAWQEALNK